MSFQLLEDEEAWSCSGLSQNRVELKEPWVPWAQISAGFGISQEQGGPAAPLLLLDSAPSQNCLSLILECHNPQDYLGKYSHLFLALGHWDCL